MQIPDPAGSARLIERWFDRHHRPLPWRTGYDPYHVLLSEVMLQQTRMEVVLPYFERFLARFPTLAALAAATEEEVAAAWSGLGYYRRARLLRAAAVEVVRRFDGRLPERVEELVLLPGIGRYTAGAIASVAWDRRAPIVDGNVARILSRLFSIDAPLGSPAFERQAWARAAELVEACSSPRAFNQGLMEVGALVCRPKNPSCGECPVRTACTANSSGQTGDFPRPKARKATRAMVIGLHVVRDARGRVLLRREEGPLMTGMLHLPHDGTSLLSARPLPAVRGALLGSFRHTITDRRIEFEVYSATLPSTLADSSAEYLWIHPDALGEHPHPSYVKKALAIAGGPGPARRSGDPRAVRRRGAGAPC